MNLALGLADRTPAESRWTNVLISMKRTLVRVLANNLPNCMFNKGDALASEREGQILDVESVATNQFFQKLNGTRIARAVEYFANPANIHELGVFVVVLDSADQLLYALLGGADRKTEPCKVWDFLHKESSIVASVLADVGSLLRGCAWENVMRRRLCEFTKRQTILISGQ